MSTCGCSRCRPHPLRAGLGAINSVLELIPFYRIVRAVVIGVVLLVVAVPVVFDDVPLVPFISTCATEQPVGGAVGAAHKIGAGLHGLEVEAPTVSEVRDAIMTVAEAAGSAVGTFKASLGGAAEPVEPVASSVPVGYGCGPCPPGGTVPVGGDGDLAGADLAADAALRAGWVGEDAVVAVAIAGAESGYDPEAVNPSSSARGMWQIMLSYHSALFGGRDWRDPYVNGDVAHRIWSDRGDWSPWAVWTSGAYVAHLVEARAAVAAAAPVFTPVGDPMDCAPGPGDGGTLPAATTDRYPLPGVQPWVDDAAEFLGPAFGIQTIYGVGARPGPSDHPDGLALDFMTYDGDALAAYAAVNADWLNVTYIIWSERIWSLDRAAEGWRPYYGYSPHLDHVHASFEAAPGAYV